MELLERKLPRESGVFAYDPRYKGKTTPKFIVANVAIDFKRFIEWSQDFLIDGKLYLDVVQLADGAPCIVLNEWRLKNAGKFKSAAHNSYERRELIDKMDEKFNLPK